MFRPRLAAASSTVNSLSCSSKPAGVYCRDCNENKCGYSVSYTEGSSIRGHLVNDLIWFAAPEVGRVGVRGTFGCQTYESGLFFSQVADGIAGFSQSQSHGGTLFDSLRRDQNLPDRFSICLSDEVGALTLGGHIPSDASPRLEWVPYSGGGSYSVSVKSMKRGDNTLSVPTNDFRSTIVDSGTSFTYLPPKAYKAVKDYYTTANPASTMEPGEYSDDFCFRRPYSEIAKLDSFSFVFGNGISLRFGPREYSYELYDGVWCLGVFDNEHSGAVIGAATMRGYEVIFDRVHRRLAFVATDCQAMYEVT